MKPRPEGVIGGHVPEKDIAPSATNASALEVEQAIHQTEPGGVHAGDAGIERQHGQQFYEPRFEPLANMSCRSISEMSDAQLEAYIGRYQELVHETEQNLESKRAKSLRG